MEIVSVIKPRMKEVQMAIPTLERLLSFSNFGEGTMKFFKAVSNDVEKEYAYTVKKQ